MRFSAQKSRQQLWQQRNVARHRKVGNDILQFDAERLKLSFNCQTNQIKVHFIDVQFLILNISNII